MNGLRACVRAYVCACPGVGFPHVYVTFSYLSELCDFVEIESPPGRELDFEGPGRSKCHFSSFGASSKQSIDFGGS